MTKRTEPDPEPESDVDAKAERKSEPKAERLSEPPPPLVPARAPRSEPPPSGEQTRVLLTGDNRNVVTEEWIPTAEFGFRICVKGQFFEHVADAVDSGTWIFAPTR